MARIAVLGAGSWGTALALQLARNDNEVLLWDHDPVAAARLLADQSNEAYLPGHRFPAGLTPSANLGECVTASDEVLVVVPSHAFAAVTEAVAPFKPPSLSWATKGLNPSDSRLLSEVAADALPGTPLSVLSGPTFAGEVANGLPTAITLAATDAAHAARLVAMLHSDNFRTYTSDDLVGVQLGGAAKNVMAIAAGISDGLGFGANARAALITRGLAEITRLGLALGAQAETFMGLAGLGDLALTCTDNQSRNRRMGLALAEGLSIEAGRSRIGQEVEGVNTAREVRALARRLGVEMPITEQVYSVLFEGRPPFEAVKALMERDPKAEETQAPPA